MKIDQADSIDCILKELGKRIKTQRVQMNLTQVSFAQRAGFSARTLTRIENGEDGQMSNYLRAFRVLGNIEQLNLLLPEDIMRPSEIFRAQKTRKRASSRRANSSVRDWQWGDMQ